ncbi:hypothetical protein [Rhodothermus profundi]|uniref:Uncharacterized protein n=1 Tax=Rhodothermus profundi TaxID=633813 RepID=A0A1M6PGD4_9BACT|nr:hypothetical protein [Rhodothermus profundi]SHK06947.1 hypothetical protein SAMN04488087_0172 [Rhodothermus profundi]
MLSSNRTHYFLPRMTPKMQARRNTFKHCPPHQLPDVALYDEPRKTATMPPFKLLRQAIRYPLPPTFQIEPGDYF